MKFKNVKLGDVIYFNPKESIKKNEISKKIPMDALTPYTRKISYFEEAEFKSGTKFRNDDTLMARITPCLENGKTSYVSILDDAEVGFGSTEYFVLRANEKYIIPKYVYYLSISPDVRNVVIKSMTGTSGRQRAQKESLLEYELELPSLDIQKRIVQILDSLDSKIELNNQIISNLEELASTLFKRWFVDFEFPDKNGNPFKSSGGKMVDSELGEIPVGWEVKKLGDFSTIVMGQSPKGESYNYDKIGTPLVNGASDFKNGIVTPLKYTTEPKKVTKKGDYIFGVRATVGNVTETHLEYAVGRGAGIARSKDIIGKEFLYFNLINIINYLESTASGSVYINISRKDLDDFKVVYPSEKVLGLFHDTTVCMLTEKQNKYKENTLLQENRDTLLPKLLSGEIEIPLSEEV